MLANRTFGNDSDKYVCTETFRGNNREKSKIKLTKYTTMGTKMKLDAPSNGNERSRRPAVVEH